MFFSKLCSRVGRMRFLPWVIAALFFSPALAQEPPYQLYPGDVVEIWVTQDPSLNRQITVQPDGLVVLPLAGRLQAEGLTLEEFEQSLRDRLQENFTTPLELFATLVSTAAPEELADVIYILGDVSGPGGYPFRRGMTVLHAVSLAGGYARDDAADDVTLAAAERELRELIVQEARIQAQIEGRDRIVLPTAVTAEIDPILLADIVRRQTLTLDVWRSNRLAEAETRARLKHDLSAQIAVLRAQLDLNQMDLDLSNEELERIRTLLDKGLATASQEAGLRRALIGPESRQLALSTELSQAEADLEEVDIQAERDQLQLRYDLQLELEETKKQMADLEERVAAMQGVGPNSDAVFEYFIFRRSGEGLEQITVQELSPLETGDLIKVVRHLTDSDDDGGSELILGREIAAQH